MIGRLLPTLLFCVCLLAPAAHARGSADEIAVAALPHEARQTLELIRKDGPFPYDRDGVVFGNREKQLPQKPRGFYHEYTVKMPGSRGRGAHRIVCGGDQRSTHDCWYSDDHYRSFKRIR